ncbi:MAG TPA: FKBP-type peptidyl-prolyl cis-trans isomerase [Ferruginibacter sp.]|jgi:FKBP-type peptidyl-prolyl cis-trans isomerase FkpA|nr:FKBP-type peptidyl-prolyl cis-trans isomerase [Ferruginibacter sp.]
MNKRITYLLLAVTVLFAACKGKYKHAPDGLEYKIISKETGVRATTGDFLELNNRVVYIDSLLYSSRDNGMPQYASYNPEEFPPAFKLIFDKVYVGDSFVVRISTDTLIKKGQAAPFMKKGQYIYQYFTIMNIFKTEDQKDSAQKSHLAASRAIAYQKTIATVNKLLVDNADQLKVDDKKLTDYMTAKHIVATKGQWGTYVSITDPGAGDLIDSNSVVMVNYTGKTLVDTVFDSNVSAEFGHVGPFAVNMGQINVIPGWVDGLRQMKKGSKGIFLIPSSLAYGKKGSGPKIGPDENLIFNVEVVDILTVDQYKDQQMQKQQLERERHQQIMDSVRKAHPRPQGQLQGGAPNQ